MCGNAKETKSLITFESWKSQLRKDCELEGKIIAFDALGNSVLRLLWEQGLEPSVKGILKGTSHQTARPYQGEMERT